MFSSLLSFYQRWAARRMFARWSPIYEEEVTENQYSAPDAVASEAIKILGGAAKDKPRILDVGIGTGLLAQNIQDTLPSRIVGLDFSEDMMAVAASRDITELLIKCDVGKDTWPIESGSCDMVVSGGLLEYLTPEMLQHFLKESKRVLQQNGVLVSSYKPREAPQRCINIWPGHSGTYLTCSYIPTEIEGLLQQNGFALLHHSNPFKGCIFSDGSSYDYRLFSARSSNS
jgi:predicted TPR repeat methyltransferase